MQAGEAIAEILKREGVEIIFGYPVNHILELAARAGIRPIIVRDGCSPSVRLQHAMDSPSPESNHPISSCVRTGWRKNATLLTHGPLIASINIHQSGGPGVRPGRAPGAKGRALLASIRITLPEP